MTDIAEHTTVGTHWITCPDCRFDRELARQAEQIAKDDAMIAGYAGYAVAADPHVCPRCNTYCDGDCEAAS